ncbi:MAG: M23 family metallopeptidase [Acidobacteriota bacterium]
MRMRKGDRNVNGVEQGIGVLGVLALLLLLCLSIFVGSSYRRWEGQAPAIRFDPELKALGRKPNLTLTLEDPGSGLSHLTVRLKQKEQDVVLVDETFGGPGLLTFWRTGPAKSKQYNLGGLIPEKFKIQPGAATLSISAWDHSFRNFWRGNRAELSREFEFDIYPPRLEILSGQHYINQGGSECVVYRVSEDAVVTGVQAGPHFFSGYPAGSSDPSVRFCLFAYAYDLPPDTPVKVIARDAAGNEAVAGFWQKVFPKKFRRRDITLDDGFLNKVVPEIMARTPEIQDQGELIKTYVEINSRLRRLNHEELTRLSADSPAQFLWDGPFLQLSNSQVESLFADHRTYFYQGKEVDRQDHVGFDLSVVQQYPIEAANDGKVILADYFGIYGNTVLIDHGCGLVSLYGHMSSIDVKVGQQVRKKEVLGKSGATGLAGGDHLHFGMFLQGVPVNPTEWWDGKWIKDHVLDRIASVTQSGAASKN